MSKQALALIHSSPVAKKVVNSGRQLADKKIFLWQKLNPMKESKNEGGFSLLAPLLAAYVSVHIPI